MNPIYFIAIAILGVAIFCCIKDSVPGGSDSFFDVMCRVLAKHVKLALKLVFWFVAIYLLIMGIFSMNSPQAAPVFGPGGEQSEKFFRFMNRATAPIQFLLDGVIAMLGFIALGFVIGVQTIIQFFHGHTQACIIGLIAVYLIWLWLTIRGIVWFEYTDDDKTQWAFRSIAACGTWAIIVVLVAVTSHALIS